MPFRTSASLGRIGERHALFVRRPGKVVHAVDAATGEAIWRADVALFDASLLTDPAGRPPLGAGLGSGRRAGA